jgi:uncharacterized protein YndB with AHSA1/START domain
MTATHSLKLSSVIKAPRDKVFAAWTTAETLRKWFAPGDRKPEPASLDVRPGGQFRIIMQGDADAPTAVGHYEEVVDGEKLVFTWGWDGDPSQPTLVTVTFKDVPGGTEVVLTHDRFASEDSRDHHRQGWQAILDKLPGVFAG